MPAMTSVCVVDDAETTLFCSDEAGAAAVANLAHGSPDSAAGAFSYQFARATYLANYRELFLKPQFGVRGWTVVASKLEADVFAPITAFKAIFFPVTGLALLVVALLSVTQVRRTLGPLEKLIDGTRRAGERDFSARVDVRSNDEFGELATSFNSMAARLGGQFTALLTLADIDQAILSRLDLDRVIETVVMRMRDIVPADFVSIAIVDRNAPAMARVYTRDQAGGRDLELDRCSCAPADTAELLAHPDGLWLEREAAARPYLAPIVGLGASSLLVLPIVWQNAVVGTVVLGFRGKPALTDEERGRARNLGDRVGVAFATAAKDEQLYYQANYDALTALPNRLYFKDQLARRFAQSQREPQQFALLFIDLDNFKSVNDSLGHAAGDEVLRQTAERLKQCVRETDTVTRLGGDEFTIILSQIRSSRDPESVAEHVLRIDEVAVRGRRRRALSECEHRHRALSCGRQVGGGPAAQRGHGDVPGEGRGPRPLRLLRGADERRRARARQSRARAAPGDRAQRIQPLVPAAARPAQRPHLPARRRCSAGIVPGRTQRLPAEFIRSRKRPD